MFAKIQSLLETMFGAEMSTICYVFMIGYVIFQTIYTLKKGRSQND